MLLWHYSLLLLWEITSVFTANLTKIDPWCFTEYITDPLDVFVSFGSTQPALEAAKRARSSGTIAEKAGNVRTYLIKLAEMEQADVIYMLLSRKKCQFESMWVSNRIYIRDADTELIKEISEFANVTYIKRDFKVYLSGPTPSWFLSFPSLNLSQDVTKGLELIQAPEAWKVLGGANQAGKGVIVGVVDTGAFAGHEALIKNFVGMNYGNYDALQEPVSEAYDLKRGTHITGTIVGKNGIGVAPAAKHSQCRACTEDYCSERAFENCIAFFICPTLQNGTQPDCSKRVHVIHLTFRQELPTTKPIVDAAISAGILLVAPMGAKYYRWGECNEGKFPGLFDEVIAVGMVNNTDHLDGMSSRGPNPNPKGNPKPDVVAPGVDTVSAHYKDPVNKYLSTTDWFISTAHVTGLVALLRTRDKTLTQDQVRKIIIENTDPPVPNVWGCDNKTQKYWPNAEFGYGRINALKALNAQTLMLTGTNKNESKLENTCQQEFDSYKQRLNEKLRNINSVSIVIREEIQKLVEDFKRIAQEITGFNTTLKKLLNKAKLLETSLKALENN